MNAPQEIAEIARPPWPTDYPCKPGMPQRHLLAVDKGTSPKVWVCEHCGLRFTYGIGAVAH